MSYAAAAALQSAVFQHLAADASLSALVGDHIYDALPAGAAPPLYVTLGPEAVIDASDKTGRGAEHRFTLSVVADAPGFTAAKTAATAICDALIDAPLTLSRGHLVSLGFDRATAARTNNDTGRRIDLRFRARVEDVAP